MCRVNAFNLPELAADGQATSRKWQRLSTLLVDAAGAGDGDSELM
jgi:hypothetical protein